MKYTNTTSVPARKKRCRKNKKKKPSWVSTNFESETKCKKNEIGAPAT
jgi:hypothetical protein